jgi:hypothetical protein
MEGKPIVIESNQNTNYDTNTLKRLWKYFFDETDPAPIDRMAFDAFISDAVKCFNSPQAGLVPINFDTQKVAGYAITKAENNPLRLLATDGLLDPGNNVRIQLVHCADPVFDRARQSNLPMMVACQAEDGAVILYWGYDHCLDPRVKRALKNILALPVRALVPEMGAQRQRLDTDQACSFCKGKGLSFYYQFGDQFSGHVHLCLLCLDKVTQCHNRLPSVTSPLAYDACVACEMAGSSHRLIPVNGGSVNMTPTESSIPPLNRSGSPVPCTDVISDVIAMIKIPSDLVWIYAHLSPKCKGHLRCFWSFIAAKCMSFYDTIKEMVMFLMFRHFDDFIACLVLPLNEENADTGALMFSIFEKLYQALTEKRTDKSVDQKVLPVPLDIDPHVICQMLELIGRQIDGSSQVELHANGPFKVDNNLGSYRVSLLRDGDTLPTSARGVSFGICIVVNTLPLGDQSAPDQVYPLVDARSEDSSSGSSSWSDCDEPVAALTNSVHTQIFHNVHTNLAQRPRDLPQPNLTDIVDAPVEDRFNGTMRALFIHTTALYDQQVTVAKVHALLRRCEYSLNLILQISDQPVDDSHKYPWNTQTEGAGGEQEEEDSDPSECSMVSEDYNHIDPKAVLSSRRATTNKVIQLLLELGDKPTTVQAVTAFFGELQMGTIDLHTFIRHLQGLVDEDDDKDSDSYKSELSANAYQPEESDWDSDEFLPEESDKDGADKDGADEEAEEEDEEDDEEDEEEDEEEDDEE